MEPHNAAEKRKIAVLDITLAGLMVAVIEVSKMALAFLPNIELTSFWLILFTLFFGRRIALVVPVFILIEGTVYGFGIWWVMYLYAWPLLVCLTWMFRRQESVWFWSIVSGAFGLSFGALCAVPYFFLGAGGGAGVAAGIRTALAWWVAGIPWDIVHCAGNFALMLVLYQPVRRVMEAVRRLTARSFDGNAM